MTAGRQHQRIRIPLLAGYQIVGQPERKISVTTDVAVGGVRFTSNQLVRTGERIKIQIKIPWRDEPLEPVAEVLRCDKIKGSASYEVATKFVEFKSDLAEEITKIIHLMQSELYIHKLLK